MVKDKETVVFIEGMGGHLLSFLTLQSAHPPPPSQNNSIQYNSTSVFKCILTVSVCSRQCEGEGIKWGGGVMGMYLSVCMY